MAFLEVCVCVCVWGGGGGGGGYSFLASNLSHFFLCYSSVTVEKNVTSFFSASSMHH